MKTRKEILKEAEALDHDLTKLQNELDHAQNDPSHQWSDGQINALREEILRAGITLDALKWVLY